MGLTEQSLSRRTLLRAAGALGVTSTLGLTGCSGDDDALTFFFQANPAEADARLRIVAEFGRRHPDIRVRTVLSGPDPIQQMSTFCAGGKCPDVLMAWELTYAGLAARGVLQDLNPMLARDPGFATQLQADSIAPLYETFAFNGGQYALPEQWSGTFVFYNKALFADAGVTPPPARWDKPWRFADFLDAAHVLTKRDRSGRVSQWGVVDTWVPHYSASLFGMNNGAEWCTPRVNPTHLDFDDDAFIEGVQFYADLGARHHVAPMAADTQAMSTMDLFSSGKAAMALGGHWRYQTFLRADGLDFDLTVLPAGPKEHSGRSEIGTTGLAIAASSRRKEQAWEFVKFAAGPVGQTIIGESGLFVPALTSALNTPGFTQAHSRIRNLSVLTEGPSHSGYLPVTPAWQEIDALMARGFGPVLRGKRPASSLAGELAHDVDTLLAKP